MWPLCHWARHSRRLATQDSLHALADPVGALLDFETSERGLRPGSNHPDSAQAVLTVTPFDDAAAPPVACFSMTLTEPNTIVGKYLISPLTRMLDDGQYAASVSIRSGSGRGTHDRVMRFVPLFSDHATAAHYATREGMRWVQHRHTPLAHCAA